MIKDNEHFIRKDIKIFFLSALLYVSIWNLFDIIIDRYKILKKNRTLVLVIIFISTLYLLINTYSYQF
jgi:hypothetical protein